MCNHLHHDQTIYTNTWIPSRITVPLLFLLHSFLDLRASIQCSEFITNLHEINSQKTNKTQNAFPHKARTHHVFHWNQPKKKQNKKTPSKKSTVFTRFLRLSAMIFIEILGATLYRNYYLYYVRAVYSCSHYTYIFSIHRFVEFAKAPLKISFSHFHSHPNIYIYCRHAIHTQKFVIQMPTYIYKKKL